VVATNEPLVGEGRILQPAEASGGQQSFRYVAPGALLLILVFGVMYMRDRARGGYKAVKLEKIGGGASDCNRLQSELQRLRAQGRSPQRLRVLFLGDKASDRLNARSRCFPRWRGTASTCFTPTGSRT
jgi:hypothetical protein